MSCRGTLVIALFLSRSRQDLNSQRPGGSRERQVTAPARGMQVKDARGVQVKDAQEVLKPHPNR